MFELEILADRFGLDTAQIDELRSVFESCISEAWLKGYDDGLLDGRWSDDTCQ